MKYKDITIGAHVIDVQSEREMIVTELHFDEQTVTCNYADNNGTGVMAHVPPASLELVRDGGLMDNA